MKKLLLSLIIVVGIGISFSSCKKDEAEPPRVYLEVGGTYQPSQYGSAMKAFYANKSFTYVSDGAVGLRVNTPGTNTMGEYTLLSEYSCSDFNSSAKWSVGDTIYVELSTTPTKLFFEGDPSTSIKIVE